jgi:peptidyl-prolyl cis-trans isomerase A (cyclophilin A)
MLLFRLGMLLFILMASCSRPEGKNPRLLIETSLGDITVEVYPDKAKQSAGAFLANAEAGLYTDGSFYRVLNMENQPSNAPKAELVQGGIWQKKTAPGSKTLIPHESTKQTGILHTDGVLSLARQEPGTASTEFFICIGNQPGFDHGGENNPDGEGYAAFGKVVKGMDVVRRIYSRPENNQYFDPPIAIYKIKRI